MIFIGIIDPNVANVNAGLEQQIAWIREVTMKREGKEPVVRVYRTRKDDKEENIAWPVLNMLYETLTSPSNMRQSVYIYFNTHGITEATGESIELNKLSYISDREITDLLFKNTVDHVSVFFECCHSAGFFDPNIGNVMRTNREIFTPGYAYTIDKDGYYSVWKSNITVFNTSLKEQKSYEITDNETGAGLATLELQKLGNPFKYMPLYVANWLNDRIGTKQYATVQTTTLIPKWFNYFLFNLLFFKQLEAGKRDAADVLVSAFSAAFSMFSSLFSSSTVLSELSGSTGSAIFSLLKTKQLAPGVFPGS